MIYYADGDNDLIRIDAPDDAPLEVWRQAPAQRYLGAPLGWVDPPATSRPPLMTRALFSGDYYRVVDDAEVRRIMGALDAERARIEGPQAATRQRKLGRQRRGN